MKPKKTCRHCARPRWIRGRGLCTSCYNDPAIKARTSCLTTKAVPTCWCCGAACPNRTLPARVGWVSRRTPESETELYCGPCFAEWGWPPVLPVYGPAAFALPPPPAEEPDEFDERQAS